MAHTITLTLADGTEVDVFDRTTITLDMLSSANAWTFSLWHSDTLRTTWRVLRAKLKLLDPITVAIDGAAQLTGRIETFRTSAAGGTGGASIVIGGRDMAGPAVTWDATPTLRLRGLQLSTALERLFAPLGLSVVVCDAAAAREVQSGTTHNGRGVRAAHPRTAPLDRSHPRAGEKVWQLADEMCRRVGYLLYTAPSASGGLALVVDAPAFTGADAYTFGRRIEGGRATGNILSGTEEFSARDVPTEVFTYSHGGRGDTISTRGMHVEFNTTLNQRAVHRGFIDPVTLPVQPRHVRDARTRTIAMATKRAQRIIAEAMAHFRRYECTVQGYGQTVGGTRRLYAINTMARVRDDLCTDPAGAPLDESMLITRVTFEGSRQNGQTTALTLIPKDSLKVIPQDG